ncbi:helix-turn-helix domain-containing protein [Piscirickettsia salmonis]
MELMKIHSIKSDAELARVTGVPASTISRLLNKESSNPTVSNLLPLANYFHVSLDQLLGIEELHTLIDKNCEQYLTNQVSCRLPVINLSQVNSCLSPKKSNKTKIELVSTGYHFKKNQGLAVKIDTLAYAPIYRQDTVLIIDCDLPQSENDILLVSIENGDLILLQKIAERGRDCFRRISIDIANASNFEGSFKIIGTVVETQYSYQGLKSERNVKCSSAFNKIFSQLCNLAGIEPAK